MQDRVLEAMMRFLYPLKNVSFRPQPSELEKSFDVAERQDFCASLRST